MKLSSIALLLIALTFGYKAFPISNYEILKTCRKQRREKACVKRLKINRDLLKRGKPIEIPVYPYKLK
tara:strand:- start:66 stop:269 length:204 start_codon:yes stop_codon:yes gene_type:complete